MDGPLDKACRAITIPGAIRYLTSALDPENDGRMHPKPAESCQNLFLPCERSAPRGPTFSNPRTTERERRSLQLDEISFILAFD